MLILALSDQGADTLSDANVCGALVVTLSGLAREYLTTEKRTDSKKVGSALCW